MTYVRSNPIQIFIYWGLVDTLRCNILYFFLFLTLRIIYNGNPFDPEKFLRCSVGICLPVFVNGVLWLCMSFCDYRYMYENLFILRFLNKWLGENYRWSYSFSGGKYKKIQKLLFVFSGIYHVPISQMIGCTSSNITYLVWIKMISDR